MELKYVKDQREKEGSHGQMQMLLVDQIESKRQQKQRKRELKHDEVLKKKGGKGGRSPKS